MNGYKQHKRRGDMGGNIHPLQKDGKVYLQSF